MIDTYRKHNITLMAAFMERDHKCFLKTKQIIGNDENWDRFVRDALTGVFFLSQAVREIPFLPEVEFIRTMVATL